MGLSKKQREQLKVTWDLAINDAKFPALKEVRKHYRL
jgi:hypothetical protein